MTHKPIQPKQRYVDLHDVTDDGFTEDLIWEDKAGQPMLNEARSFRFFAYPDGARRMDVRMQLKAISQDVTFGMLRDHGLLAIRMVPVIADTPNLEYAQSESGDPKVTGKRAAWCDESGQINGKTYGVAILDATDNIRHPPHWHAGAGTHIGPDIVGPGKSDSGPIKPDGGPLTIKSGATLTLRYRIVFHNGDGTSAGIAQKFAEYAAGK